jgi:hypothetical protein
MFSRCAGALLRYAAPGLIVLAGCGSHHVSSDYPLGPENFISRDGILQYRIPAGWSDASNDAQSPLTVVWLVRNDYAATISVREVRLDPAARYDVRRAGIKKVAHLSLALSTGSLLRSPHIFAFGNTDFCAYEIMNPSTLDTIRVVLFDTGSKVYEVSALLQGGTKQGTAEAVFAVQQSFVQSLRW